MTPSPIVVTRVAVRSRTDTVAPSEAWIRHRVDLLRRVAWPALRATPEPVAWVLLVDPTRRDLVAELTDDVCLDHGSVQVAEAVGFAPTTDEVTPTAEVHPGATSFVTVRLDSDDALLPGSIRAIIDVAETAADGDLVDLPHGYQFDTDSGAVVEVYERSHRQGPFLAVVHRSRATMFDTGGVHTRARSGRAVHRIVAPTWIQTVHGANLSNRMREASMTERSIRALRALPRGESAMAWADGRPVAAAVARRILDDAGIVEPISS